MRGRQSAAMLAASMMMIAGVDPGSAFPVSSAKPREFTSADRERLEKAKAKRERKNAKRLEQQR